MKHSLLGTLGVIVLAIVVFGTIPAEAQTVAPGPYYATPSWDQQLPASTRFIVLSNWGSNAVLDRETGLVWERSPSTSGFRWYSAHSHCNTLTVGNRKGWRVPTIQELASLVDGDPANTSNPRLPPGHPFTNVQPDYYWSATTIAGSTPSAWAVYFYTGFVNSGPKDIVIGFVWCVRGGQGVDPQ